MTYTFPALYYGLRCCTDFIIVYHYMNLCLSNQNKFTITLSVYLKMKLILWTCWMLNLLVSMVTMCHKLSNFTNWLNYLDYEMCLFN